MTDEVKLVVGASLEEDLAAFKCAWTQAERGEQAPDRVLAFGNWEQLAALLTGERYRLLRHVHAHPQPSVSALARSLGRHLRRVQVDVSALAGAGLLDRSSGGLRCTADLITTELRL